MSDDQHIYHHSDQDGLRIAVKLEKNTKGFNYEASVSGAKTVAEAIMTLDMAKKDLEAKYGPAPVEVPAKMVTPVLPEIQV